MSKNKNSINEPSAAIEETIIMLELDKIKPDPDQPRREANDNEIKELRTSIEAMGVIHPILVRKDESGQYIIVSGERRWTASDKAGKTTIPARIVTGDYEVVALAENLARKNLLAMEESIAAAKIFEKMQGDNKVKQKELADKLGIAESTMSEILKPAELPKEIKDAALKNRLWSRSKLLILAKTKDKEKQKTAFEGMKATIATKDTAKNQKDQDKPKEGDKDAIQKAKKDKASAKKVAVLKKHTVALNERISKAITDTTVQWTAKERVAIQSDLEKLIDTVKNFLDRGTDAN